jgi:hypothetical protein
MWESELLHCSWLRNPGSKNHGSTNELLQAWGSTKVCLVCLLAKNAPLDGFDYG